MPIGRELDFQAVHYLRRQISFNSGASAVVTIGTLPAGAAVLRASAVVQTAFNAGTNNNVDIGIAGATTSYASALSMSSVGAKAGTGVTTSAALVTTGDTDVIATLGLTGTAATAGVAIIIVEFVVNNDK